MVFKLNELKKSQTECCHDDVENVSLTQGLIFSFIDTNKLWTVVYRAQNIN